jgi:hypothetical protein
MTNTLAYYDTERITTVKSLTVHETESDEHSSLLRHRINYACKKFYCGGHAREGSLIVIDP